MLVQNFSQYPAWLTKMLFDGNFAAVTMAFGFPVTFHYGEKVYLVETPEDLMNVLAVYKGVLHQRGMRRTHVRVINTPDWTARKFKARISQTFHFDNDCQPDRSKMDFYVERKALRPAIRMVHIEALPFANEILASDVLKALKLG